MTTKIELDELKRKAFRLVTAAKRVADRPIGEVSPCDAVSELGLARSDFDFAATAPVTLALVARVHELEAELDEIGGAFDMLAEYHEPGTPLHRGRIASIRALLAKGAVIP